MPQRLTQPLTEMGTRNISWRVKAAGATDSLTAFMCRLSWNLGDSTSRNPQGLSRPVMGMLYLFTSHIKHEVVRARRGVDPHISTSTVCADEYSTVRRWVRGLQDRKGFKAGASTLEKRKSLAFAVQPVALSLFWAYCTCLANLISLILTPTWHKA